MHSSRNFALPQASRRNISSVWSTCMPTGFRSTALRLLKWAAIVLVVVLLLPYLLAPLYRFVDPVSTLMLWRRMTFGPGRADLDTIGHDLARLAARRDGCRGRALLHPPGRRFQRVA
jgi:hypothetical protein